MQSTLIFLSYRRDDSSAVTRWLGESFRAAFGESQVFIDTESLRLGDNWPKRIHDALQEASVVIPVLGPKWLRLGDEYGRRRLDREDDWVRNEILHALDNRRLLIPLLVSGASLPVREALPPCLVPMLDFQSYELREDHWAKDREALLARLEQAGARRRVDSTLPPISPDEVKRREALIFDQQLSIFKTATSLVYRAKNAARSLKESPGRAPDSREPQLSDPLNSLGIYQEAITTLLYEERAMLPPDFFYHLHDGVKQYVNAFRMHVEAFRGLPPDDARLADCRVALEQLYHGIEKEYDELLALVQSRIGVTR